MSDSLTIAEIQDAAVTAEGATVIEVTYQPELLQLKIEPRDASISPGSAVFWKFNDLPEGYVPLIHFESGAPGIVDPGPLTALCLNTDGVSGEVASGVTGAWVYQVLLHPTPGHGAKSQIPADNEGRCIAPDDPQDDQDPRTLSLS